MDIAYQCEEHLPSREFVDLLNRSTLAERRPVNESQTIEVMLREADIVLTARNNGKLVGVSRAITDRAYCTYLSDLAVDQAFQQQGIGKELIRRTHLEAGLNTTLVLLAAPKARDYYPHIGMHAHESCWTLPRVPRSDSSRHSLSTGDSEATGLENLDTERLDTFFDDLAVEYDTAIRRCVPRYDEMQSTMLGYLPSFEATPKILELGAGTGALTERTARHLPGSSICAADLSAESLKICEDRVAKHAAIETITGDMRELDFEPERFDCILSSIAIHHLTSSEKQNLFSKCFGWLKPNGVFSYCDQFSAPTAGIYQANIEHWHRIALSKGATEAEWQAWMEHQDQHDYHDPLDDQMQWLKQAGFEQVDCQWRHLLWTVLSARKPGS